VKLLYDIIQMAYGHIVTFSIKRYREKTKQMPIPLIPLRTTQNSPIFQKQKRIAHPIDPPPPPPPPPPSSVYAQGFSSTYFVPAGLSALGTSLSWKFQLFR
jgi:hypothetical protein